MNGWPVGNRTLVKRLSSAYSTIELQAIRIWWVRKDSNLLSTRQGIYSPPQLAVVAAHPNCIIEYRQENMWSLAPTLSPDNKPCIPLWSKISREDSVLMPIPLSILYINLASVVENRTLKVPCRAGVTKHLLTSTTLNGGMLGNRILHIRVASADRHPWNMAPHKLRFCSFTLM